MIIITVALVAGSSFSIRSAETIENQPQRDFNQLPELIVKSASTGNHFIQQNGPLLAEKEKHCFCLNLFEIKKKHRSRDYSDFLNVSPLLLEIAHLLRQTA